MSEEVLAIRHLSVTLHRDGIAKLVLENVSLTVGAGEIVGIVGESGSGKSTIGHAVQGLLPHASQPRLSGSILLGGEEIAGASPVRLRGARRTIVRAIPQDPLSALNPTMTIGDQLRESTKEPDIVDWLQRTGLPEAKAIAASFPHRLSGGQRQRVLIAMAMMAGPKLLIADEPTTALDASIQAEILDLLRRAAREQNVAILFITHDLGVAAGLADRLVVLHGGRVVEVGPISDVIKDPGHPYTAGLLAARFDLRTERRRPLPTLPSAKGSSAEVSQGCNYVPRCPIAKLECASSVPALRGHPHHPGLVACLFPGRANNLAKRQPLEPWPARYIDRDDVALKFFKIAKSFPVGARSLWSSQFRLVLKSVDLSISRGECVALLGNSGAGKSTLLKIAAGLLQPDGGYVFRTDNRPQVVFQDAVSSLTPWLTVGEQIGERLRRSGMRPRELTRRVEEAMEMVELEPALLNVLPADLSVGQCQRAVVARAVVVPPKLLLCDEPISAMDASLSAAMLNLFGRLRRRLDMATLFVTHDLAAARIVADRIAVLREGEIVIDVEPDARSLATLVSSPGLATTFVGGAKR